MDNGRCQSAETLIVLKKVAFEFNLDLQRYARFFRRKSLCLWLFQPTKIKKLLAGELTFHVTKLMFLIS